MRYKLVYIPIFFVLFGCMSNTNDATKGKGSYDIYATVKNSSLTKSFFPLLKEGVFIRFSEDGTQAVLYKTTKGNILFQIKLNKNDNGWEVMGIKREMRVKDEPCFDFF